MRTLKIKKVDDKPMVIHTKEKAKIHSHEPKGARIKGSNIYTVERGATQNVFKYTQTHREIKVLADTSYCFDVYALAIVNNTLLTSSCTLHSRKFLR